MTRRFAILTSGGDAPGMNAAIRAATTLLHAAGCEVLGVQDGYRGLIRGSMRPLGPADVLSVLRDGGTVLGSARCPAFHERATRDEARRILAAEGVEGLLVIGGNGSLTGANLLADPAEAGPDPVRVVGLPASIDNDIGLTGLAIGVDTAMNTIVEACDKISDTASAHNRTFIVQVMGRDCGYLAMTAAVAAGADGVLFPESGRSPDDIVGSVVRTIRRARQRATGQKRVLIVMAEGTPITVEDLKARVDMSFGDDDAEIETRVTVLGHVVRGGRPSAFDRLLAGRLARVAVEALLARQTRKMAAYMTPTGFPEGVAVQSPRDPYCWLVDLEAVLAETARMLEGDSALTRWRAQVFDEIEDVLSG